MTKNEALLILHISKAAINYVNLNDIIDKNYQKLLQNAEDEDEITLLNEAYTYLNNDNEYSFLKQIRKRFPEYDQPVIVHNIRMPKRKPDSALLNLLGGFLYLIKVLFTILLYVILIIANVIYMVGFFSSGCYLAYAIFHNCIERNTQELSVVTGIALIGLALSMIGEKIIIDKDIHLFRIKKY